MRNFTDGLLVLSGLALGGFMSTVLADILNVPYETMGLYCFYFAIASGVILLPYFLVKWRQQTKRKRDE